MSILCCHIPDFLIALHTRRWPEEGARPLALVGEDERLWATSSEAQSSGVLVGMTPRQAQMRCADLLLRPLDSPEAEASQQTFLFTLGRWELPVEPLGWGGAYLDLHTLATRKADVESLGREMGQNLRERMSEVLLPALGWDSGKFTAQAAARRTRPGRMKLVDKADETHFLSPLPISLLPLPPLSLQQLHWLGIRSLGDFAALPHNAVWQRFGEAGKLAWRWAQGKDDRPVSAGVAQPTPAVEIAFDLPERRLEPVLAAFAAAMRPLLARLADRLQAIRRLGVEVHFLDGSSRSLDLRFVEGVSDEKRLTAALSQKLSALIWPDEMTGMEAHLLESSERPMGQLALLPDVLDEQPLPAIATRLAGRYGPVLLTGRLPEPGHCVPERRGSWQPLAAGPQL